MQINGKQTNALVISLVILYLLKSFLLAKRNGAAMKANRGRIKIK